MCAYTKCCSNPTDPRLASTMMSGKVTGQIPRRLDYFLPATGAREVEQPARNKVRGAWGHPLTLLRE